MEQCNVRHRGTNGWSVYGSNDGLWKIQKRIEHLLIGFRDKRVELLWHHRTLHTRWDKALERRSTPQQINNQ